MHCDEDRVQLIDVPEREVPRSGPWAVYDSKPVRGLAGSPLRLDRGQESSLSSDARYVAFESDGSNLVAGVTNAREDIFVHDRVTGTTTRASISDSGAQANHDSRNPALAGNGATVAFQSDASNLVPADTNAVRDVFVRGAGIDAATYGYDRLYRLTSVDGPDGIRAYAYDPVGNRTSKVLAGSPTSSTYDRADRITAAGSTSVTVNAAGATTAIGSDTYGYDQANRLVSATVSGASETYAYDGDGVRFTRTVGTNPAIRSVSDVAAGLPVTIDDGTHKYVWGLGLAYAVAGSSIEVYHPDRLGSVRALTDATGAVIATYRTDEWGIPTATTGSSSQPFGFTGEPADATGLSYLRSRYYDPNIGRFMTRDTWPGSTLSTASLHRYVYAHDAPTTRTDPSGHCIGPLVFLAPACVNAAIGVGSYVVSTVVTNVIGNVAEDRDPLDDPLRGLNPVDAAISGAAGAIGGPLGGIAYGPTRVLSGVALGCAATFAFQATGGRTGDLLETGIGCAAGSVGSIFQLSSNVASFTYGSAVAIVHMLNNDQTNVSLLSRDLAL